MVNTSPHTAFNRRQSQDRTKHYEDGTHQEWLLAVASQAAEGGRDGINTALISSFHSFCVTFGRSQQTSLPSVLVPVYLLCLQDSQAGQKQKSKHLSACAATDKSGFLRERPQRHKSIGRRPRSARLCSWLCERDRSDKGKHFQDTSCKHTNGLRDKNQSPRNCTEQQGDNSERER